MIDIHPNGQYKIRTTIENALLGTWVAGVRFCVYYSKAKYKQGYCIAVVIVSRFLRTLLASFSYMGCP